MLAPAGDWDCARAAVENGADAIYFGLERFNARMRARNFTVADLPGLMEFLHRRGVRGYVTLNTLVFEGELGDAEAMLRSVMAAGVDAAIVQDVGVARLIRRCSPDFPIHASTQMTVTSAAGVEFARRLGCNLVVLARECSLKDIAAIRAEAGASAGAAVASLPLEVFVHGALCVAYSGQCLTSESLGGRSANRGECAQACRMPYELIRDGTPVALGDRRYLLSPQDLSGLEVLPELVRAGVSSLKIEGRLKSPEYVAGITRAYRRQLEAVAGRPAEGGADRYAVEMAFSRGLFTGWFRGINNQELVHARFGKKRGVYLGEVARVQGGRVRLGLAGPLKPGDGVVFDAGRPEEPEEGGRVYEVRRLGTGRDGVEEVELAFGGGDIDFSRVRPGHKLWKTSDPELDRQLRQTFEGEAPRYQRPVQVEVHGRAGQPLTLLWRDEEGHVARVDSAVPLAVAEKQPLGEARLREQLGRLGGTPFRLDRLVSHLEGGVILPVSELNQLRRSAVAELERQRARPKRWTLRTAGEGWPGSPPAPALAPLRGEVGSEAGLIPLLRTLPQLEAALAWGARVVYCDFENPKKYREAVGMGRGAGAEVWVAPPRITKPGEEWILKQVRSSEADGYLVRNYDHLEYFRGDRRMGDFSLNVANSLAAEYFRGTYGLERLTASCDLDAGQLESLLRAVPAGWLEIILHQHMPMFHMEHCVFCAFLSEGTDYTNCGRPCDRHEVRLRDRVGAEHVLKADVGCRNTVFNARAQTGAEHALRLREAGARHFRVEFVDETPATVTATLEQYARLLRGEIGGAEVWRDLQVLNQLGVTRGTMNR
ncbi:MAG: putative protease YhbU precursor [Verrucomicrobiota bacterium]